MLNIVASYHCMQFQGKLIIYTQKNGKKPNFGPDLRPLGPYSDCKNFFFPKIWISQSLDIQSNDPLLKIFSDGRTDGQTDENDFIGRCPSNVERPIYLVLVRTLQKRKNIPD